MRLLSVILILVFVYEAKCARILGIFVFPAKSHYILGNALMKGLAAAGHDVTMVSPYEEKNPPRNGTYRDIVLTGFAENYKRLIKRIDFFQYGTQGTFEAIVNMYRTVRTVADESFEHENVRKLINSNETFDAVIVEQFVNDALKFFAYRFQAPLILLNTWASNMWVSDILSNPSPPSYIPHYFLPYTSKMSFLQRLCNTLVYIFYQFCNHFHLSKDNKTLMKHIPNAPHIYDLYYNASLVLLTSHESFTQSIPLVPNMIQIGGYHVAPSKKLPRDLQEFLDNSKEGVVYFSLGSNIKSKEIPLFKLKAFMEAFSKLKEKVLWKWEDDVLSGQPGNVKVAKWFPQQDILAHPNIKLFVTHAGYGSIVEAVYHGVPMLTIPVFGDQYLNAQTAVSNGYALSLPYHDPSFSEENLSKCLKELLENPKYRNNMKRTSQLFHDRPMKPMETAVFWVEYVIRNKGAAHLKVAGAHLTWYQYLLLDVVLFVVTFAVVTLTLLYIGIRRLFNGRVLSCSPKLKEN